MTALRAPAASLASHPALPRVPVWVAEACRVFYGRQLEPLIVGNDTFTVRFEEVLASRAGMQLHVRCGGNDFELQIIQPAVMADLGPALTQGVPEPLRRAAVMHALQPLWQALEQRLGATLELLSLDGAVPACSPDEALGLRLEHGSENGGPAAQTALLLRALRPIGWRRLARAGTAGGLIESPAALDVPVEVSLQCDPVGVTVQELASMEAGDVLLLDARADRLRSLPVRLLLGSTLLPHISAVQSGCRLEVTSVLAANAAHAEPGRPPSRRHEMNASDPKSAPEAGDTESQMPAGGPPDIDAVMIDIELELGRLSLPLSALRTLAVGQVFETVQPIEGNGVVLWCGGRRLGLGQLVAIGDRLGVRIAALQPAPVDPSGAGRAAASATPGNADETDAGATASAAASEAVITPMASA
ncbi:MAG: FliM/FliN family flagellar motor switch protein [Methylibium sp.]|uniref:FliM/FliN family flagellar motor switch protein n=1 Tax=Methylibium sp. TaxID=2067992 RepID=UPI0017AE3254|nr:FliM/FliN family flagellar motor switch protein [Methylibium sp.]MBA3596403.1 FliM/FliN family flagellar motor switch protein [Methylibium sp.]